MAYLKSFCKNGKFGYEDDKHNVIVPAIYEYTLFFYNTKYCCVGNHERYGIINEDGDVVVPIIYQEVRHLVDNLFAVKKSDFMGVVNSNGEIIVPIIYQEVRHLVDNLFAVKKSDFMGVINSNCDVVIPFEYEDITECCGLIVCCNASDVWHNRNHNKYLHGDNFYQGIKGTWYNPSLSIIHSGIGLNAINGYLLVWDNYELGLKDMSGKQILPYEYEEIHCVSSSRIIVKKKCGEEWLWGVLSNEGEQIIPFEFKLISLENTYFFECFKDLKTIRQSGEEYTYPDKNTSVWYNSVGELIHEGIGKPLTPSILAVSRNGIWGAINQDHELIVNFGYDEICALQNYIIIGKDKKLGILSSKGEIIIPPSYEEINCIRTNNLLHGGYSIDIVFDTDRKNNLDHFCSVYYSHYNDCPLVIENPDIFNLDSCLILSNEEYAEIFTAKDGVLASSKSEIIKHISESNYAVRRKSKWGVFSFVTQDLVVPCKYDRIRYQGGNVVLLNKNGKWGATSFLLPSQPSSNYCKVNIPIKYYDIAILEPHENLFGVKKDKVGGYSLLLANGERPEGMKWFPDTDSQFKYFRQDRIMSSHSGKWGFISESGYVSIPFKYDYIESRIDGLFDVQIDGKWGLMDIDGKDITAVKYKERIPLSIENAIVQDCDSGRYGMLSYDGTEKVPTIYQHLFMKRGFIFCGYGGEYSGYEDGGAARFRDDYGIKWGCITYEGKLIISPEYELFHVSDNYILAEKEDGDHDLFSHNGQLIVGGFGRFEQDKEYLLLLLNAKWHIDESGHYWYETDLDKQYQNQNSAWLVLDKNLLSVKLGTNGEKVQFNKGFRFNKYNLDVTLLDREKPTILEDYMLTSGQGKSRAIRLCDGKSTDCYDEIEQIDDYMFFVRKDNSVGIISLDNQILLPLEFFALTNPVNGYIFAFKEIENSNCSVDLVHSERDHISVIQAIPSKPWRIVIDDIIHGRFKIFPLKGKTGLKSVSSDYPSFYDNALVSDDSAGQYGEWLSERGASYWFSSCPSLMPSDPVNYDYYDGDWNCQRETWDAMTDGMYGDMPDGFDDDYSFMGRG